MKKSAVSKKITLSIFAIVFPCFIFCQPAKKGSLQYLSFCNGFKPIELGSEVERLDQGKLAYLDDVDSLDSDGCYKFCYKDSAMLYLGHGLLLNRVGLRTYNNRIVNIYLFFPRNAGHEVLQNFEANYGECTGVLGEFMYDWKTTGVTLSLRYSRAIEMGVAIFTCVDLENQVIEDGNKRKTKQQDNQGLPVTATAAASKPE
jgi:hypothetical protein